MYSMNVPNKLSAGPRCDKGLFLPLDYGDKRKRKIQERIQLYYQIH